MSIKTFAAIDIGSFELRMKIYEFSGKNHIREIDNIAHRLDLGSGTYANGKILSEKLDDLCRHLNEFVSIMKTYKVDAYKAYATSAIRETDNATIVQDQIKQRTNLEVRILSNSEQRFLDYKSVAAKGESFRRIIEENTAILDIGGGSIQLSLFENDTLVSTQNLRLGVLRLQEMMKQLGIGNAHTEDVIDEYISAQLAVYKKMYLKDRNLKNVILVDEYISPWALRRDLSEERKTYIDREDFKSLTELLARESKLQCAVRLGISEERVSLVEISAILVKRICRLLGADMLWAPGVTLCDGMAYEYGEEIKMFRDEHDFEKDIVACALNISKKYMGSRKRSETLESITTVIFDSMKKIHGLGKRERLYLQLASILHDCGKYISLVNIGETSYDIIMATEIIGLSHVERQIVANVVRFNHSPFLYYGYRMENQVGLPDRNSYLTVAKLTAILRLANSLDRSHKQKLEGMKAVLQDNQLMVHITTSQDTTLESGFFELSKEFFREVYSVEPVLKVKRITSTKSGQ